MLWLLIGPAEDAVQVAPYFCRQSKLLFHFVSDLLDEGVVQVHFFIFSHLDQLALPDEGLANYKVAKPHLLETIFQIAYVRTSNALLLTGVGVLFDELFDFDSFLLLLLQCSDLLVAGQQGGLLLHHLFLHANFIDIFGPANIKTASIPLFSFFHIVLLLPLLLQHLVSEGLARLDELLPLQVGLDLHLFSSDHVVGVFIVHEVGVFIEVLLQNVEIEQAGVYFFNVPSSLLGFWRRLLLLGA
mmetsp:Transcript_22195/g.34352  ORF Transcript_22195/g.34352 Transcript_22195/m.34352 type:complete len:243 (+) Transcript_22195:2811-3539(+)|eukprot:CAMPEP_0170501290 /NCGR_PEP_ID=MMETSP0208-20121228/37800_1 /TAXON_ID=197538 /ORGANISM="Strombidium inclinatum, Strain S3" /LENGTH=242 /DNA_ID=CAMNT_0010779741 /DNA_START=2725 /DNA_END=3453 /DNA_ORIENTATION=+